ncbi:MAG: class II aldolase/adducin family protein [Ruaniaceae bacterium]|nr:class II aldolase/adducin family protein [Ruaniaceae bacterium]
MNETEARNAVVAAGKRLVEIGLIARTWGNVSARISDTHFVITPSGREYLSLTPEEIVPVAIADRSHTGPIKPSGERGVHAEIYRAHPHVNFVIHTHQEMASIVASTSTDSIPAGERYPELGERVLCSDYALPSTKAIRENVAKAARASTGNAIIMKNHGAVVYGEDSEQAFAAAESLEVLCRETIRARFLGGTSIGSGDDDAMRRRALSRIVPPGHESHLAFAWPHHSSERTPGGFVLHTEDGELPVPFAQLAGTLSPEAHLHREIYLAQPKISHVEYVADPDVVGVSTAHVKLRPLIDDFAQIVGPTVKTATAPREVAKALKSASAVLLASSGAYCVGGSRSDADAVRMILVKNCRALLYGAFLGELTPISPLDSILMRVVYLKSYSQQISSNV